MAMKKQMEILVKLGGELVIETHGIKGSDCEAELKPIVRALGEIKGQTRTSEYWEQPQRSQGHVQNKAD